MKDFLEYFPLKRYGAIAILLVFPLFSLYYLISYKPSINTVRIYQYQCQEQGIAIFIETPRYIANNSEIKVDIQNYSEQILSDIRIIVTAKGISQRLAANPRIYFDEININQLNGNGVISQTTRASIYDMQNGEYAEIYWLAEQKGNKFNCMDYRDEKLETTYNEMYAWLIGVLTNTSIALSFIFFFSVISCSITQDDSQDFHPSTRLGKYHIARVAFRASVLLTVLFALLQVLSMLVLDIGVPPYYFNNFHPILVLSFLFLISFLGNKFFTILISKKPKAKIIIDGKGKEKEVEIIKPTDEFNIAQFWVDISKKKK